MLRPSRPMMRPFVSSLGSVTTETVVSAVWSTAHFWIARVITLRALLGLFNRLGLNRFHEAGRVELALLFHAAKDDLTGFLGRKLSHALQLLALSLYQGLHPRAGGLLLALSVGV